MTQAKDAKAKVVEIEAMDESDWEREWGAGHETPEASAEGVATLVRKTAESLEQPTAVLRKTANVAATIPRSSVPSMATVTPRATPLPMRSVDPAAASGPTQPRPRTQPPRRMPLPAPNEVPIVVAPPPAPLMPARPVVEIEAELPQAMHMPRMTSAAEQLGRRADATPNRAPGTLDAMDAGVPKLSARPSKRALMIAGGALAVGALVIVFAMTRSGGDDPPAVPQTATTASPPAENVANADEPVAKAESAPAAKEPPKKASKPAKADAIVKAPPIAKAPPQAIAKAEPVAKPPAAKPAVEKPPAAKPAVEKPRPAAAVVATAPATKPVAKPPAAKPVASSARTVARPTTKPAAKPAAKRVATAAPPPDIDAARTAYGEGNQALFAGDPDEAIRAYQRVLASAPTYASGYRGLGLAYAEKGDTASAIKALRKYVELAPRAKDAVLVQKRIEMLKQSSVKARPTR